MGKRTMGVFLASVLSVLLIVSGCGNSNEGGQEPSGNSSGENSGNNGGGETVKLRMAWWGSKPRNDYTVKVLKQFEKKNENIEITPEFTGWTGYWTKMSTEFSGGSAPDILQMDKSYLRGYAERGSLMPLKGSEINLDALDQKILGSGKVNGKLYAIPTGVNALALFYNPDMLKKAGVTINPDESMTWEKYAEIAKKVHQKLPDVHGTQDAMNLFPLFKYYVRDKGEQVFSDDGKTLKLSKQTMIDWFNYWLSLMKSGAAPSAEYSAAHPIGENNKFPLALGESPFGYAWTNQLRGIQKIAGDLPIKMAMLPSLDSGNKPYFLKPSMYWSIAKQTDHPKAAGKLVNYFMTSPDAAKLIGTDRGVPINSEIRSQLKENANDMSKRVLSFVNDVSEVAGSAPPVPPAQTGQIIDLIHTIAQKVEFKRLTPEEATDQFFSKAKSILKKG